MVLGIVVVLILYFVQDKPLKNGFNRGHIRMARIVNEIDLKYNYWYIDSLSNNRIFLANYKAVLATFSCTFMLNDSLYGRIYSKNEKRDRLEFLRQKVMQMLSPNENSFSADGFISYNPVQGYLVYSYYYRNTFIRLDSGMRVIYTGRFIDTNTVAKLKLGTYESAGKKIRKLATPSLIVNKRGYLDGNYFYNESGLVADDENRTQFKLPPVVIDVYRISDGRLSHSIYLPGYKRVKLTDFAVRDNHLFALYDKHLIRYQLPVN